MGFTRFHFVGVFATESLLCTIGASLALASVLFEEKLAVRLLLGALCSIALAIAVILASILSLLFFAAWPNQSELPKEVENLADERGDSRATVD